MPEFKLRVQVGRHRGRVIQGCGEAVRPSMGWMREVVFNWLFGNIQGFRVLDACAGTGIWAFEALSLGAASAVCIDSNQIHLDNINKYAGIIKLAISTKLHQWPKPWSSVERFDLIFWDPPYDAPWRHEIFSLVQKGQWLKPGGYLCIESSFMDEYQADSWELIKSKVRGQSKIQLWQYIS